MSVRRGITLVSRSEGDTIEIGKRLAGGLRGGDLLALDGPLGAGKTCLVRGIAAGLGINPLQVASPTFVICHEYEGGARPLIHLDAYRLRGPEDLESIGWSELLESTEAIIAVEWPSRIAAALPAQRIDISLLHESDRDRRLIFSADEPTMNRLAPHLPPGSAEGSAACRMCGKPIERSVATFPFCSKRCRMADLGKWFSGGYRVSRPVEADEELSE